MKLTTGLFLQTNEEICNKGQVNNKKYEESISNENQFTRKWVQTTKKDKDFGIITTKTKTKWVTYKISVSPAKLLSDPFFYHDLQFFKINRKAVPFNCP